MSARERQPISYAPSTRVGRLYWRELPGGGFVALDIVPLSPGDGFIGMIIVERRAEAARREGSSPPVIAEACGRTTEGLLHRLLPIARSNPAIGSALLRQGSVSHGD